MKYFLGLDGGGSKTRAVLVDSLTFTTVEEISIDKALVPSLEISLLKRFKFEILLYGLPTK